MQPIFASAITQGRVAQLVQSTWFTPKGSGVRIPSRPQNRKRPPFLEAFFSLQPLWNISYIFCTLLDRYYVGSTRNISVRIEKHLQSKRGFTSAAKDWKLCYSERFDSKEAGLRCEREIKRWKSRKMLEKLIANNPNQILFEWFRASRFCIGRVRGSNPFAPTESKRNCLKS